MPSPLTPKQETFCLKWLESGNASEAVILAGYKTKNPDVIGAQNLAKLSIQSRITELRQAVEDATVATVLERKQILSEIARGRFVDFMTNLTAEKLKSAALQEIRINELPTGKSTTIKLHSPIQAIGELNKMEKIYTEGTTVNIDNRRLEITVGNESTKKLLGEIEEGIAPHGNPDD